MKVVVAAIGSTFCVHTMVCVCCMTAYNRRLRLDQLLPVARALEQLLSLAWWDAQQGAEAGCKEVQLGKAATVVRDTVVSQSSSRVSGATRPTAAARSVGKL